MAALRLQEDTSTRLTFGTNLGQRISNIISLVILAAVGLSLLSSLGEGDLTSNPLGAVIAVVFAFFALSWVYSALASNTVVIDTSSHSATNTTSLLWFPVRRQQVSLDHVRRVLVSRRVPGMGSRQRMTGMWQVALESTDGPPLVVNSNGAHDEMVAIAKKVAALANRPIADEGAPAPQEAMPAAPAVPGFNPIQDFSGGGPPSYAPPVASPSPFGGSRAGSPLPDKQPPPNTFMPDVPAADQMSSPGSEAMPASPAPPAQPAAMPPMGSGSLGGSPGMPSSPDMGMPPLSQGYDSSMPPLSQGYGSSMPPLEAGPAYSAPPGLGLPDQAPLGEASNPPMEGSYMAGASSASPAPPPSAPRRTFEQLQQAIAQDSTDSTAYYQLARMFQARGAMGQSLEMYQNVARLDPLNAGAQNDLGVLYFQRGNLKDAETTLRRATALDPFSPQAHYNLGLLLLRTGRRSDAQQEFNRAAQNAPAGSAGQVFAEAQNGRPAGPLLYPGL